MRTKETEKRVSQCNGGLPLNQTSSSQGDSRISNGNVASLSLNEERLAVMAAIAKEVADQSEAYSAELEMELHRLNAENQALRELLAIQNNSTSLSNASPSSAGGPNANPSSTSVSSTGGPKEVVGGDSSKSGTASTNEWAGVPSAFK